MAFLDDITKGGRAAGQGLIDVLNAITSPVAPILEQIPKIAAQYQAYQGNPIPMQLLQQEQNRGLMNTLMQQQMQGPQPAGQQPAFQIQQTPAIEQAIRSGDTNAFNKEVAQQKRRSAAIENINASSLPAEEKQILNRRLFAGDNPDDVYKQFESARTRQTLQAQKKEEVAATEQRQIASEQRRAEQKAQATKEGELEFKARAFAKENPNADASQWAAWLNLHGVKEADLERKIKSLEDLKIKGVEPTLWNKVKNAFSNLISPSVPPANPPAGSTSSQRKLYYNPATKTVE